MCRSAADNLDTQAGCCPAPGAAVPITANVWTHVTVAACRSTQQHKRATTAEKSLEWSGQGCRRTWGGLGDVLTAAAGVRAAGLHAAAAGGAALLLLHAGARPPLLLRAGPLRLLLTCKNV